MNYEQIIQVLDQYKANGGDLNPVANYASAAASPGKTPLGLNQWQRSDKPVMDDFNADNKKIDEGFAALQSEIAALRAELAKKAEMDKAIFRRPSISEGEDLNDFLLSGYYSIGTTAIAKTLINKPNDYTNAGMLLMFGASQILTAYACTHPPGGANMWFRNYYGSSDGLQWTPWKRVSAA